MQVCNIPISLYVHLLTSFFYAKLGSDCSSSTSLNNGKHYTNNIIENVDENIPINGNGTLTLRRTTSECGPINGSNGKSHQVDSAAEDEWSRESSEERSDYGGTDRQSTDDLDKKV